MLGEFAVLYIKIRGGIWRFRLKIYDCTFKPLQRFYLFIYYMYFNYYGGFIAHSTHFDSEPCLPHGAYGVFIAGGARLGNNCVIFQHVTIGANPMPFSKTTGFPTIGDNCYIGAGATIIGAVKIGNNCRIGANCTVFSDLPDNSIALSPKPRIIQSDKPLENKYYRWTSDGPIYFDEGKWIPETNKEIIENLKSKL